MMDRLDALRVAAFKAKLKKDGIECPACHGVKDKENPICRGCLRRLPATLKPRDVSLDDKLNYLRQFRPVASVIGTHIVNGEKVRVVRMSRGERYSIRRGEREVTRLRTAIEVMDWIATSRGAAVNAYSTKTHVV